MDSHANGSRQANSRQESQQSNSHGSTTMFPKHQRVAKLSKQQVKKPFPQLQLKPPPSSRIPAEHHRKLRHRQHGDFIILISTVIRGRLLVSPWPDDPFEDPVTGAVKSDSYTSLSRTGTTPKSPRGVTTSSRYSPTAANARQPTKNRISTKGSSVPPQPIDMRRVIHSSTVQDKNTLDSCRHQTVEAQNGSRQSALPRPMSQVRLTDSIESPTKEKDKARTRNSMGITSDTTIARLQSNGFCSKESVISGDGGDSGGGDEDPPSSSIDSVDPFSLETYQPPRTRPRRTARQILEELTKDPETEIVSSSMPSVTSSAALAAGIEDIEGYLEQDLKGFTRLSY